MCAFTVVSGGAARLVLGYDSYGNTCGRRNPPLDGVRLSGLDHTDRKSVLARSLAHAASGAGVATHVSPCPLRFVFFLDPCNIDIVQRKMKSVALCVALCPPRLLHTYHDLMTFATLNGDSSPHARARAEEVAKNDEAPGAEPGPSRFFPGGPFGAGKKRQLRPA